MNDDFKCNVVVGYVEAHYNMSSDRITDREPASQSKLDH